MKESSEDRYRKLADAEVGRGKTDFSISMSFLTFKYSNPSETLAKTFKEMLNPSVGNSLQRFIKWYIKPRGNPDATMGILKAMQVDKVQRLAVSMFAPRSAKSERLSGKQLRLNYRLSDSSVESMVRMATVGTVFNEAVHTCFATATTPFLIDDIISHDLSALVGHGAVFWLNGYLTLAQRYTRARL